MANLCIKTPSSAILVLIFQLLVLRPRPSVPLPSSCLQVTSFCYKLQVRSKKVVCISHKQSAYSLTRCIFVRIDNAQYRMATAQAVIVCPFLRSSLLWTWFAVCTLHKPFIRLSAKTASHAPMASNPTSNSRHYAMWTLLSALYTHLSSTYQRRQLATHVPHHRLSNPTFNAHAYNA